MRPDRRHFSCYFTRQHLHDTL